MLSLLFICVRAYSMELRERDTIETGARPFYGITFGKFDDKYDNPLGFLLYGRGFYELNIYPGLNLFPEACTGWLYMNHSSESARSLNFFPLYLNCMLDWNRLKIDIKGGSLCFNPFVGMGSYYTEYKSRRKTVTGFDFGYQFGLNTVYRHEKLKDFYIELNIDRFFTTEKNAALAGIRFSLGVGYKFSIMGEPLKKTGIR